MLTALGATTLLGALWFVPSANATAPAPAPASGGAPVAADAVGVASAPQTAGATTGTQLTLADTGGVDTTPYVLGGTVCLGIGAGFVVFSARRARSL
ncbi:hypothetical protein EF918_07115 [Streptomyces sp. WAC06614]|nr:hypothetical protein EF918_07115 [Streptomyces sp. WAC06614]